MALPPSSAPPTALLDQADRVRRAVAPGTTAAHKAHLGQFMTPTAVARFMATLFVPPAPDTPCRLLDAGAGVGALTAAFLDRWQHEGFGPVSATAFEIDPPLRAHLSEILGARAGEGEARVRGDDFIAWAVAHLGGAPDTEPFTHAILNPPYKKLGARSPQRALLRSVGIDAANLYAAFVALALACLGPGGQLVAIVPRSFCNGPHHKAFRAFLMAHGALCRLHLFQSRTQAFQDDGVLQETLIVHLERGAPQGPVRVSVSTDAGLGDLVIQEHPFGAIVESGDPDGFIHVPLPSPEPVGPVEPVLPLPHTLADLGVKVATGPIVSFRAKAHLRDLPGADTVPLIHPSHFSAKGLTWPRPEAKKPNALVRTAATERGLYPNACCVLVRRVSSKEERRRVVARVFDPAQFPGAPRIGFENHLNVLHAGPEGLPLDLAWGLHAYLGTAGVDAQFRRFSGHTQVNATDLRRLRFPGRAVLAELGAWCRGNPEASPGEVEAQWLAFAAANRALDQDQRAGVEHAEIG